MLLFSFKDTHSLSASSGYKLATVLFIPSVNPLTSNVIFHTVILKKIIVATYYPYQNPS